MTYLMSWIWSGKGMNKTRPKQLSFRVSEEEYQQLQEKISPPKISVTEQETPSCRRGNQTHILPLSQIAIPVGCTPRNEATGKMPTRSVSVVFIAVNRFCPATAKIVPRCVLLSAGIAVRSLFRPPEPPPASERRTEASILHIESKSIRIRLRRPFIRYESKQKDYGNDKIQGHAGTSLR